MATLKRTSKHIPSGRYVPVYPADLLGELDGDKYVYIANGLVFLATPGAYTLDIHKDYDVTHVTLDAPIDSHIAFSDALWAHMTD